VRARKLDREFRVDCSPVLRSQSPARRRWPAQATFSCRELGAVLPLGQGHPLTGVRSIRSRADVGGAAVSAASRVAPLATGRRSAAGQRPACDAYAVVGRPTGTVTFLFTDVEGSTRLWDVSPAEMPGSLRRHDEILRTTISVHGGYVFSTAGDSFGAAFQDHQRALAAARDAQERLAAESWAPGVAITVRMGLHIGVAEERDGNYFGSAVNLAARLMAVAHGGQLVVSGALHAVLAVPAVPLGVHLLKDLPEPIAIWQVPLDHGPTRFPPLQTQHPIAHNLPTSPTPLIGRDAERARVVELLRTRRVVTVTGVGGMGKTRLALEVGGALTHECTDGVWLSELAPADTSGVPARVAAAVGAVQRAGMSWEDSLLAFLAGRDVLVILDNCEHVLAATARLVEQLIASCERVRVLATSREALGVSGEYVVRLEGLGFDGSGSPAAALFVERARAAGGGQEFDSDELAMVERICARLDGLPLAIELAACRTRSIGLADIDQRLGSAFRLLAASKGPVDRHQTMDTAIAWSVDALSDGEQQVFRRLAVFTGGFDLAAAEGLCAGDTVVDTDVADVVDRLVDKSLVVATLHGPGRGRFRLLEPVRWFARQRLHEAREETLTREQHAAFFAARCDHCYQAVLIAGDDALLSLLDQDRLNLLAAVDWSLENDEIDTALRIVLSGPIGVLQYRFELHDAAERLVRRPGVEGHPRYVEALTMASAGAFQRGRSDDAASLLAAAQRADRSEHPPEQLALSTALAEWFATGDPSAASQALQRLHTTDHYVRFIRYFVGSVAFRAADFDHGQAQLREGINWARSIGAQAYEAALLEQLAQGEVLDPRGSRQLGADLAEQARTLAAQTGLRFIEHQAVLHLARAGIFGVAVGNPYAHLQRALRAALDAGATPNQWFALGTAAHLLARDGLGVEAALIDSCRRLDPFGHGTHPRPYGELYFDRVTDHDRAAAAQVAATITETHELSTHVLRVLATQVEVDTMSESERMS
jgi:predicted ATPase/class 3 adenylate cyclase